MLELQGEKIVLKCSPQAAFWVSRNGGFLAVLDTDNTVMRRLYRLDLETMGGLIRAAMGHGPSAVPSLEEQIWREGLRPVSAKLVEYVENLMNGGRKAAPEGGGSMENPPQAGG